MSFLLSDNGCSWKELSYNELISVNGGCEGGIFSRFAQKVDSMIKNIAQKIDSGKSGQGSGSAVSISGGTSISVATSSSCSGGDSSALANVSKSINANKEHRYLITGNPDTEYRCDQWVEEVLTEAGRDSEKYLNGTSKETVTQHISKLEEGSYSTTIPTDSGAYVVFMSDGKTSEGKAVTDHCGILLVKEDGKMEMWDNSSCNNVTVMKDGVATVEKGGIEKTNVYALSPTKVSAYLYDTYYFQEVK